jgi:hypothetical protein
MELYEETKDSFEEQEQNMKTEKSQSNVYSNSANVK